MKISIFHHTEKGKTLIRLCTKKVQHFRKKKKHVNIKFKVIQTMLTFSKFTSMKDTAVFLLRSSMI